jgi:hypothetical protein
MDDRELRMTLTYRKPEITDHGTLAELTAAFDVSFLGSAAKLVTMAAVSVPVSAGIDVAGATGSSGTPAGGTLGQHAAHTVTTPHAAAGSPAGSGAAGGGASGGGGGLPFTGYPLAIAAGIGTLLSMAGYTLRAKLRRRPS